MPSVLLPKTQLLPLDENKLAPRQQATHVEELLNCPRQCSLYPCVWTINREERAIGHCRYMGATTKSAREAKFSKPHPCRDCSKDPMESRAGSSRAARWESIGAVSHCRDHCPSARAPQKDPDPVQALSTKTESAGCGRLSANGGSVACFTKQWFDVRSLWC